MASAIGDPCTGYSRPSNLASTLTTLRDPSDVRISSRTTTVAPETWIRLTHLFGGGMLKTDRAALNAHVPEKRSGMIQLSVERSVCSVCGVGLGPMCG